MHKSISLLPYTYPEIRSAVNCKQFVILKLSLFLCWHFLLVLICPSVNQLFTLFYTLNYGNVGTLFFFFIKWKLKDFQITWANILFTTEHREHNKCLNRETLHFYALNELISNLMTATGLKKCGTGATKGWKSITFWKDSAGRTSSN